MKNIFYIYNIISLYLKNIHCSATEKGIDEVLSRIDIAINVAKMNISRIRNNILSCEKIMNGAISKGVEPTEFKLKILVFQAELFDAEAELAKYEREYGKTLNLKYNHR